MRWGWRGWCFRCEFDGFRVGLGICVMWNEMDGNLDGDFRVGVRIGLYILDYTSR